MSPRHEYPRSAGCHEVTAARVLELHARERRWSRSLPVPIEAIVGSTYGIRTAWNDIAEVPGETILAVLHNKARTIVLNERHRDMLAAAGPTRLTLAHELGHWLYDSDPPEQSQLFDHPVFCRNLADGDRGQIRELNADGFASALLMPPDLVRARLTRRIRSAAELNRLAREWGVSRQALRVRLQALQVDWCLPEARLA